MDKNSKRPGHRHPASHSAPELVFDGYMYDPAESQHYQVIVCPNGIYSCPCDSDPSGEILATTYFLQRLHLFTVKMGSAVDFPPPPQAGIDWDNMGVGIIELNGHIESRYSVSTGIWSQPKLVKSPIIGVHGLSPALNYGQQAYEGMKAFRGPDGQISIFRLHDHALRLAHSSSYVGIPTVPPEHFAACALMAVAANAEFTPPHGRGAALYLRPLVFGLGGQSLALAPPEDYLFCVFVSPINAYLGGAGPLNALVLDAFDRAAPRGTGSAKVGGNYAPVMPWSERASREGFGLMLHLDSRENAAVDEFSSCGFIGIEASGTESTYRMIVPDSKSAIKSVTSDSCVQLAKRLGWEVVKRRVLYSELKNFAEVLAVGTAVTIVSVGSITRKSTNDKFVYSHDGMPGKCCLKLLQQLQEIQHGVTEDEFDWLVQVEETAIAGLV